MPIGFHGDEHAAVSVNDSAPGKTIVPPGSAQPPQPKPLPPSPPPPPKKKK